MSSTAKTISGEELDRKLDDGEDILDYLDLEHPIVKHHPPLQKRVTLTMPAWMIEGLDAEADDLAISRNAVVNTWIAERLRATQRREPVAA
ncbi:type II toxin-antitoxin system BrnA family antitoxin [Bifidobacterium eulemuris]|uniref:Antitoxin n=1 Tax=Bifidobacterium eulemuris TaxID=1765219 RepID=A0A261GEN8_9BIFI|nr:antitoxin [Bifidobacterium eulemuris]OZG69673.1 antitoxin [Bifidobacterium eulemuris]QOL32218.1 antitoxin [Bifidobacterium eulemuris]